jgi:hypothetical protein
MKSLLSLPLFLASFVVAALTFLAPTEAHAQTPKCRISQGWPLILHNDCPDEFCNISLDYIAVFKHPCLQCCVWGTATLTCSSGTTQYLLKLCANCGSTNSKTYFCPSAPGVPAEQVFLSCDSECF